MMHETAMKNAFRDDFFMNSFNLSHSVGFAWVQICCALKHDSHDSDRLMYCWSDWKSWAIAVSGAQPRSLRSACIASYERFLANSHNGDSGIWMRNTIIIHYEQNICHRLVLSSTYPRNPNHWHIQHEKADPSNFTLLKAHVEVNKNYIAEQRTHSINSKHKA